MIALLDVLGHRLIALGLCPLNAKTLVHGSNDAAVTIHSDDEATAKLSLAAKHLNLKAHKVCFVLCVRVLCVCFSSSPLQKIRNHSIPLAVDTEVHRGTDGRIYVIDLSRVLPPQEPDPRIHLSHLYRMLRPELVHSNPEPLCSDAASGFVSKETDAKDHIRVRQQAKEWGLCLFHFVSLFSLAGGDGSNCSLESHFDSLGCFKFGSASR